MALLKQRWVFLLIPAIGFLSICALVAVADVLSSDALRMGFLGFAGGDKVGHLAIYGMFAFCSALFGRLSGVPVFQKPRFVRRLVAAILAFAYLEEGTQLFLSTRSFEWLDLVCDTAGIVIGTCFGSRFYRTLTRESIQ